MQVVQFITDSAAAGLDQIHRQLGPEAVVLSVRRLPAHGVARLWPGSARIEILAGVPDPDVHPTDPRGAFIGPDTAAAPFPHHSNRPRSPRSGDAQRWQSVEWLESLGLAPRHADRLRARLDAIHPVPPQSPEAEWDAVRTTLAGFWPAPPAYKASSTHVFIGPPGGGKSTVLCKWLTLGVLTEERTAAVWRLDNSLANTAEFLSVHCEMLGAPVERMWSGRPTSDDLLFFDLPGMEMDDPQATAALRNQLSSLPPHQLHLVLNAAYEADALMAQFQAFASFEPADVILTHLDEERYRIKLWNLVLGTNCCIRFLSAGQKIPGEFRAATPELLFPSETRP